MSSAILSHSHNVAVGTLTNVSANAVHYTMGCSRHDSDYHDRTMSYLTDHVVVDALHNAKSRYDEPKCHPETRVAVQQNILTWITDGDGEKVLWLTGPAGTGKTAIASTIAGICQERGLLVASFFFSAFAGSVYRQSKARLVPTLAYQLLQHCRVMEGIDKEILASIDRDPLIFEKCLADQFRHLVLEPLCKLIGEGVADMSTWPNVILLDGVDECMADVDDDETISKRELRRRTEVVHEEIISLLLSAVESPSFPFRVIIASRPEPVICAFFSTRASTILKIFLDEKYDASGDIALFLGAKFGDIRRRYHLPNIWPAPDVITMLVNRASGQFIYAATVIRCIENSDDPPQLQLQHICEWRSGSNTLSPTFNPFASLDVLYARILESSPKPSLSIKWILAIRLLQDETSPSQDVFIKYFLEAIPGEMGFLLGNLSSLISVSDHQCPSFRIYHQSLLEFITDSRRSRRLHVNEGALQLFLKERWDETLRHKGPQCPSFGSVGEQAAFLEWYKGLPMYQDYVYTMRDFKWWFGDHMLLDCQTSTDRAEPLRPEPPHTNLRSPLSSSYHSTKATLAPPHMVRERSGEDPLITRNSGIIILLLGRSGAGKSHFINVAAGRSVVSVTGDNSELAVRHFTLDNPLDPTSPDKLILVDTPGFDNYRKDVGDAAILHRITEWLITRCSLDARFGGVIYFHDITQDRAALEYGQTWPAGYLTEPEPARHLILATVKWDRVAMPPHSASFEERENTLVNTVWRRMLDKGARVARFMNTRESAVTLLAKLLELQPLELHILQKDLMRIRNRKTVTPAAPKRRGFSALYKWFK